MKIINKANILIKSDFHFKEFNLLSILRESSLVVSWFIYLISKFSKILKPANVISFTSKIIDPNLSFSLLVNLIFKKEKIFKFLELLRSILEEIFFSHSRFILDFKI